MPVHQISLPCPDILPQLLASLQLPTEHLREVPRTQTQPVQMELQSLPQPLPQAAAPLPGSRLLHPPSAHTRHLRVPYSALTIANCQVLTVPLPRMLLDLPVPSPPCCLQSETKSCQLYPESPDVSLSLVVYALLIWLPPSQLSIPTLPLYLLAPCSKSKEGSRVLLRRAARKNTSRETRRLVALDSDEGNM